MLYSQQAPSPQRSASYSDNEAYGEVGRSGAMLRMAVVLCTVLIFFIFLLWQFISLKIKLTNTYIGYSSSIAFTALLGDLMTNIDIMIAILSVILIVRLLPIISTFAIYIKSKKYNSAESTLPFLTIIQIFGFIEGLAWAALAVYDIIQMIKNGFSIPKNAGSVYYMVLVLSVIMVVCKIAQGFLIPGFINSVKRYIHTGNIAVKQPTGLRFASILLATANIIILIFVVVNIIILFGIDTFFDSFGSLWYWYVCLLSYTLSNMFFVSLINFSYRRISLGSVSIPKSSPSASSSYSPYNTYSGGYAGLDQNSQNQNNLSYQNGFSQNQNNPPYQNGFSQNQNNPPYQNGFSQNQNNPPYQNGFSQNQNNSPSQNNENTGSGFSDSYGDLFKFK